ncbi:DMT family transporter [Jeotgalibacillus proteolyticus]|uniref:DMT family transporter n=1 Tax=Jeotgalibacillus proteolyticus TaxID=2082395 RepID=UPI001FD637D6|nr:DMT family transporter [Jeotgalibacillus proteolyticus]
MDRLKRPYVLLFLTLAPLFWAGNYVLGEYVVEEMPPLAMTFIRWLIAIVLLIPLAQIIEKPDWKSVLKAWKLLTLMALLGIIGYNFLLYEALRHTTPVNASLVNSISPILIVILSTFLLKEKLTKWNLSGLVVSLSGVLLVLTNGDLQNLLQVQFNAGDVIMLMAVICWSIYSILGRRMTDIPPIAATTVSVVIGLVMILPIILYQGLPASLSTAGMAGIVYMGLFPSVGAFVFWNVSLRYIDASKVGIFLYLIPVFTAIISVLQGKPISLIQAAGGILVFIGVYLNSRK